MSQPPSSARTRLDRFLLTRGPASSHTSVTALTGDASDRRYFRVTCPGAPSSVAAVYAGPITFAELPFSIVARLLASMPVPVPAVLGSDDELGVVLLEDLGDTTLQTYLTQASAVDRRARYVEALEFIATIQRRGHDLRSDALLPYQLSFDVDKLMFEFRFFITHFLEAHRAVALAQRERTDLERACHEIARELAAEPRVLCHRDYHSRNLMWHRDSLFVIDFQDARLGPDTYDVVSLLHDAYVDFVEADVDDLIEVFLAGARIDPEFRRNFRRRFDLMTVQRTMKALGTFGFQATSRGNPSYLVGVPRTLAVLARVLTRYTRFSPLHRQLAGWLPELE